MNADQLLKIFYSNWTSSADWQNLDEIAWMISEDMISVNPIPLLSYNSFKKKLKLAKSPKSKLIKTGESIAHMALKLTGADFLINNLKIKPENIFFEYPLSGFEVDLIDSNLNFPVECGDTSAIKLEKYLSLDKTEQFFIIPYPHLKDLLIYSFTAKAKFFEYNSFKKDYLNKKNAKLR